MRFFYYCYYRICGAYKRIEDDFDIYAMAIVSMCQSFTVIAIILFAGCFRHFRLSQPIGIIIILGFVAVNMLILRRKKYDELDKRWKNEKHRKLKGWLVLLYVLASLALYFVALPLNKIANS